MALLTTACGAALEPSQLASTENTVGSGVAPAAPALESAPALEEGAAKMAESDAVAQADRATDPLSSQEATANGLNGSSSPTVSAGTPRSAPQLIKTADLNLQVQDTDAALQALVQQIQQQGGDVLQLENQVPTVETVPHSAYVQVRVPQDRLDRVLGQLASLGKVTNQRIQAQDVANQLVDLDARLRNLQKAETLTLGIMERSGKVSEVLEVAQELSRIREQIEQINAQLQQLKLQVAYSTVNIYLEESVTTLPPLTRPWREPLGLAWQKATRSLGEFTQGLLVSAIWLLVYSPYWLAIAGGSIFLHKFLRRKPSQDS